MLELFIRYLHFIAIFGLLGTLAIQNFMLQRTLSRTQMVRLARVDALYGLSAVTTLAAGLTLWLWVGKPSVFYSENPVFIAKLSIFIGIGLVSIYPTVFFTRNRKATAEVSVPVSIIRVKRFELMALLTLPLLAVFMARGIGLG